MNQVVALERIENPNSVRRFGFIPAVLYGKGVLIPQKVKIAKKDVLKLLRHNSKNSKVYVDYKNNKYFCVIKDVQLDYLNKDILHLEFQVVHEDEEVKIELPVIFEGEEFLEAKGFILETYMPKIEVMGRLKDLPEVIKIDVKDKKLGDKITIEDLNLGEEIKILEDLDKVIAVVSNSETEDIAS
jgi:large subunit ribosomal protein L25